MPKYAATPELFQGSIEPPFMPCDLCDANGKIIDAYIKMADTDTGEVIQVMLDAQGNFRCDLAGDLMVEVKQYPAPLTVLPGGTSKNGLDEPIIVGNKSERE